MGRVACALTNPVVSKPGVTQIPKPMEFDSKRLVSCWAGP